LIVDTHCHIVVPELMTSAVPAGWRPVIRRDDGHRGDSLGAAGAEDAQRDLTPVRYQ